jgi:hypothetical protein
MTDELKTLEEMDPIVAAVVQPAVPSRSDSQVDAACAPMHVTNIRVEAYKAKLKSDAGK